MALLIGIRAQRSNLAFQRLFIRVARGGTRRTRGIVIVPLPLFVITYCSYPFRQLPEDKFVDAFPFLPPTPLSGTHADPTPEPLAPLEPVLGIEILLDENRDPKSYKINGTEILRPPATLMPISPKEMSNKTKFAPSPSPAPTRVGNMVRNLERRSLKVPVLARDDADDEWLPLPEDGNGPEV